MTPEWLVPLGALVAALLAFAGGLVGHLITSKKNRSDLQQSLIDQLQEERSRLDAKLEAQETRHAEDVHKLNVRITGFYADKSASRRYITDLEIDNAQLRAHITRGDPPPPIGHPPAPPEGYIP